MKLRTLLATARHYNASDIHLLLGMPPMFRVDGDIIASKGSILSEELTKDILNECLNPAQRERLEREWQICVSHEAADLGRARIAVYKRNGKFELSIRLTDLMVRTRAQLGLPAVVEELARRPNGLVILTGPTGVGKTTTLHFIIDLINAERSCKIITIEDPIEYIHRYKKSIIVQQEVLIDLLDFQSSLRHVLRQDPDVIAVGEMRDPETIYTALTAAETGHLVIATLHTPGAVDVVQRLVSAFPAGRQDEIRFMLSSVLQGVIAQQLLPRAAEKGRVLACEVLMGTPAVRHQIRENSVHQLYSEMQSGRKLGMNTMDQSLLDLYQRGEITYDTAVTLAVRADSIKRRTA